MHQFKTGDKAVIQVVILNPNYTDFTAWTTAGAVPKAELMPCVDAVDRIPSLGDQEAVVNSHLPVEPNPTREMVLLSSIDRNEKLINTEWEKSEPNLDRINMLSRYINEAKLELKNIQTVKIKTNE